MSAFKIDTSGFDRATKELQRTARQNTINYGRVIARQYEHDAQGGAPWVDKRGNARGNLNGTSEASGTSVRVVMGGRAPNYKQGALSASDYMEYLEFGHGGRFAIVGPTAQVIAQAAIENFGEAALKGNMRIDIKRNRKELDAKRKAMLTQTAAGAFTMMELVRYSAWQFERNGGG